MDYPFAVTEEGLQQEKDILAGYQSDLDAYVWIYGSVEDAARFSGEAALRRALRDQQQARVERLQAEFDGRTSSDD